MCMDMYIRARLAHRNRTQELDCELGKLLGEGELYAILFAGVSNYTRISARKANTVRTYFSRLMHLCK